jgi:hypothetical protein
MLRDVAGSGLDQPRAGRARSTPLTGSTSECALSPTRCFEPSEAEGVTATTTWSLISPPGPMLFVRNDSGTPTMGGCLEGVCQGSEAPCGYPDSLFVQRC